MASMDRGMRRNPAARPRRRATEEVEETPEVTEEPTEEVEETPATEEPTEDAENAAPATEEPQEAPVAPEEPEAQEKAEELPDGLTIEKTLEWVGDDGARAQVALDAENKRDKPRKWALKELEKLVQADLL